METARLEQRRAQAVVRLLHKYGEEGGGGGEGERGKERGKGGRRGGGSEWCILFSPGNHAGVGKVFMRLRGIDLGPPRLPVLPLPLDQAKALEADLRDMGFFDWA